jgi:uncharacterized protein
LQPALIHAIGRVEYYLVHQGLYPVRVRYMADGVRIETPPAQFNKLLSRKDDLIAVCREEGFTFVTLDLAGLKSGSWDELS